jgi:uncharacterized protein with ATP-grasp and redox domains
VRTYLDCVPCFVRQAIDAVRLVGANEGIAERVLRRVLTATASMRMDRSPPFMGREIHRIIREETGYADPYASLKQRATKTALDLIERVGQLVATSPDPFEAAVCFAIAGNVMDCALASTWDAEQIDASIEKARSRPVDGEILQTMKQAVSQARDILYIGDNAGETVFDRLLIEQLPKDAVTYVVKGSPIINDAVSSDALAAGIDRVARIESSGSDAPGTILELCDQSFIARFENAELVIAKGQANLETLGDVKRDIFFLTQVKCPVVARDLAANVGDWVVDYRGSPGSMPGLVPPPLEGTTS